MITRHGPGYEIEQVLGKLKGRRKKVKVYFRAEISK